MRRWDPITGRLDRSGGSGGSGGAPSGPAGGDLNGTYPNPAVTNDSHAHTAGTLTLGHGDLASGLGIAAGNHTMATARLLGRTTGGTGAVEELTVGTGLTLAAGALSCASGGVWDWGLVTESISSSQDWGALS